MDCRKIFLVLFVCFLFPFTVYAKNTAYDHVVFFGDSLTDNGNLYSFDLGVMPKSPPYDAGRFSNGSVWADMIANYLHDPVNNNYAVGGETVFLHNPFSGYLPYSLTESINSYLLHTAYEDRSNTLFIIWIGANDYLSGADDVDQTTSTVVEDIKEDIETLISHDAAHFIIINLPDMARIPYGKSSGMAANLSALVLAHNLKLASVVSQLKTDHATVDVRLFDVNQVFNRLLDDTDNMNKQYHTHLTNTVDACWTGGYTVNEQAVATAIQQRNKKIDANAMASYIAHSPALAVAYNVGERYARNESACSNPDDYLFWDEVHPTTVVHGILSQAIIDFMNQ